MRHLVIIGAIGIGFISINSYHHGVRTCQSQAAKTQQKLIKEKEKKERENASALQAIEQQNADNRQRHSDTVAHIISEHASELREHESRAAKYRDLSEARAAELAELTARYDRIIVDGRNVAARCKAGIEYRDRAINVLVSRIKADIELIGSKAH